jgi:hypothetical protein
MHRGALPDVELLALLNLAGDGLLVVTNLVREQIRDCHPPTPEAMGHLASLG